MRCLPGRHRECGLLSRQLVSPAPPQHCALPILQSPDGSPGTTGLPLPCDRLTSRKRDKAQALWPHPQACEGPRQGLWVTRAAFKMSTVQGLPRRWRQSGVTSISQPLLPCQARREDDMQQAQDRTQTQRQSTGPPALALACGETTSVPHLQQGAGHTSLSSCRGQDDQGTAQHPRAKLQPVGDIQGQPGSSIGSLVADTAKHARPARSTPATGTARLARHRHHQPHTALVQSPEAASCQPWAQCTATSPLSLVPKAGLTATNREGRRRVSRTSHEADSKAGFCPQSNAPGQQSSSSHPRTRRH